MRNLIILFLLVAISLSCRAQNLVQNGNFEYFTSCPISISLVANCPPWRQYHSGTSDYFNACVPLGGVDVPTNGWGYQYAANGDGYMGAFALASPLSISPGASEYIAAPMAAMTVGTYYEVSMSVNLSDNSSYGCNGLGIWFYDAGPTSPIAGASNLNVLPQVHYNNYGILTDTQNWVRLSKIFLADSAYDNLVIGRFDPPGGLDTASMRLVNGFSGISYYFFDSVVVRVASGINNLYNDSLICTGDTIQVPYTLNSFRSFSSTNTFTVQLSNASGSFSSGTTNIGTLTGNTAGSITCIIPNTIAPGSNYRLRILSTNSIDSSYINQHSITIGSIVPTVGNSNSGPICPGSALNLFATSAITGISYQWTGPNGFTSTLQNPVITSATVAATGNYIVKTKLMGCVSRDTTYAVVLSGSSIQTTASNPACENDTLKLSTTLMGSPVSFSWTGPNSFISNSKDTFRTNANATMNGDYVVAITYSGCTIRDTVTVQVSPLATNRTASSNSPVCIGDTLRLYASTTNTGVSYTWIGPNNFIQTSQNAILTNVSNTAAGRYAIIYSRNGCPITDSVTVSVNLSPIAITATATTPVCVADTLRLYSTNSTTGAAYSWVGPNSFTSSGQNPYIANTTMAAAGDYIATASLSNGCTRKDTVTVQVRPLPANFNAVAGNTCEGNTFFLAGNTSSAGVSFSWTGPNGFTSTLQNPNISPATTAATGNYYVTGMLNGCSIRDTVYGSVYPIPARPLVIANTPVCVGQDLKLNVSNPQSGTYSWQGVGGYSAAVVNPVRSSATTAMAGKYYVTVTANGCASDKDSVMVVVNPAPSINMYPSPKDSICQGATLTFISSTANAGTSYQRYWYRNNNVIGGTSNANYSTTTAADNDEYYVTLVATGVCADPYTDTSNKITMRVFPWLPASVSIAANPSTTVPSGTMINFTATPVNGGNKPTYQWTRNGTPVVGALSNIWGASTLSHNDEICVNMGSSYLCPNPKTAKSNCIKVSIETTGISGMAGYSTTKVYPNPATNILNIDGIKAGNTIMLYDISGRLLLQQTALANQATINIASVAAGVYQLVIADISTVTRFKITKE